MSALDMLASAETSSDLQHHDYQCAVDVLGAAGLASIRSPSGMILYRLKYLNEAGQIENGKAIFIRWAYRAMQNRKQDPKGASRIGVQALTAWLGDVCGVCHGRKHKIIDGTPTLSDKPCGSCGGSGKNRIKASGEIAEVMRDVAERADAAVLTLQGGVDYKLGRE